MTFQTRGKIPHTVEIDDGDWTTVSQHKWWWNGYPYTTIYVNYLRTTITLHRFLLGSAEPGFVWDHKDRNTHNNHRDNLQQVTFSGNAMNRKLSTRNTSGTTGVHGVYDGRWQATIYVDQQQVHLGYFHSCEEAVACRLDWEKKLGYRR